MTTQKEKHADASSFKDKLQSPKNVPCSICLDAVETAGDRSVARLKCGHHFHLDCIGSAFNAKGAMQCPNCRQVEGGQWLFSSGCYLQQPPLRNTTSDEEYTYTGMLYNLYRYDEPVSHPNRRPPYGAYRQIPAESEYPSSTSRWRAEVPPWNARLNEMARPLASDLEPSAAGGMYIQNSQPLNMHRAPVLPNSRTLDGPMPRQRMDEDEFLYHREPATGLAGGHWHTANRGAGDGDRELAFNVVAVSNMGSIEQSTAPSRFQEARYGQLGGVAYNTRRVGAYPSRTPSGHEWGNNHESVRRVFATPYSAEVHHLHPLHRASSSHSYYDGHHLGTRVPWL